MAANNPTYNTSDRIIISTIILLLMLLLIFVFALINISSTYQNKKQPYHALTKPHTDIQQITIKQPAPAMMVEPPVTVAVSPVNKPESKPSKAVVAQPPVPARIKKQPPETAVVAAASQPEKPKPTTKKETRVTRSNIESGYIKLGQGGNILPDDATDWVCVQDRATGLIWEVKTDDNSTRDRDNFFTWYEPAADRNHGMAGARNDGRCKGGAACDTLGYAQAINQKRLCGFNDWRLPTKGELLSLVQDNDGSTETKAKIAAKYFPRTAASWYWTASSNPHKPDYAWFVLFGNGQALNALKRHPKHVRLVRSRDSEKKTLHRLALHQ